MEEWMAVDSSDASQLLRSDPDLKMGLDLLAHERRERLIQMAKIYLVWVVLITLMVAILLQLRFDPQYIADHYAFVVEGVGVTIGISLASIAVASVLALLGALGRLSNNAIAQGISGLYVSFIRGTPLLIQIFLIYNGLPQLGAQLRAIGYPELGDLFTLTAIQSGILALSVNYGAYMTEIFRAGIQSIAHGQSEAAEAIGMSRWQMLRRIILPQAVRIIIPDIGNQFIAMQKDSALVYVMGVWEITYRASRFARRDTKFLEMYLVAAALYWLLTIVSSWLEARLERRLARAYER
jgi:polar amino acid transport system permease protein